MIKWLLKKFFKPETLAAAAVEAGVERLNGEIQKRGLAPTVTKIAKFGKQVAEGSVKVCAYLESGDIDTAETAEIKAFVVPIFTNAFNKVLN